MVRSLEIYHMESMKFSRPMFHMHYIFTEYDCFISFMPICTLQKSSLKAFLVILFILTMSSYFLMIELGLLNVTARGVDVRSHLHLVCLIILHQNGFFTIANLKSVL